MFEKFKNPFLKINSEYFHFETFDEMYILS